MLAIKLKRIGKKHQSAFRIIVAEKRSKMGGKNVTDLGFWNPREKKHNINKEKTLYWISKGAQPTDTVHNLLVNAQIIEAAKKSVHDKKGEKAAVAEKEKSAREAKEKAEAEAKAKAEAEAAAKEAEAVKEEAPTETEATETPTE